MDWFVRAFLKAGLAWLVLGVTLGVAMAVEPTWAVYRTAHMHMNFLGFVTMTIYGVAYHVIPRFSGSPLKYRQLAGWHWWISNTGLALMVAGFVLRVSASTVSVGARAVRVAVPPPPESIAASGSRVSRSKLPTSTSNGAPR